MEQKRWCTCPKCGGSLYANSYQMSDGDVYRTAECLDCGFVYYEVLGFIHNENLYSGKMLDEKGNEIKGDKI